MLQVTEEQLGEMGFTIDPVDPGKAIPVRQAAPCRPDDSWTTEQLQDYVVAVFRQTKALLGQARKHREQYRNLVRQTAYERGWIGYALHILEGRLKCNGEWSRWLRQHQISRTTASRTIRGRQTFADLGGLEALKTFCLRAMRPQGHRNPLRRSR